MIARHYPPYYIGLKPNPVKTFMNSRNLPIEPKPSKMHGGVLNRKNDRSNLIAHQTNSQAQPKLKLCIEGYEPVRHAQ